MNTEFTFDKNELYSSFKDKNTSTRDKVEIIKLIRYSNGYKDDLINNKLPSISNITMAKNMFLDRMKQDYYTIGEEIINFIIELRRDNIFKDTIEEPLYRNNMNLITDLTLEMYSSYSNKLYKIAKSIINNKSILVVENIYNPSYMTYLYSLKKCFCVIDKLDSPYVMCHEIEHSIELNLNFLTQILYAELGPITFETLFTDQLVEKKYPEAKLLYINRIRDDKNYLNNLYKYFNALLYVKKKNFNLSNIKFIEIISNIMEIDSKDVIAFVKDEIAHKNLMEQSIYLISHIKSLEIRNMILDNKDLGLKELLKSLTCLKINFDCNEKSIDCIKSFVKEKTNII